MVKPREQVVMSLFQVRRNQLLNELDHAAPEDRTEILLALDRVDEDEDNSLDEILDFANAIVAFADCQSPGYMEPEPWMEICHRADNLIVGSLLEAARPRSTFSDA